MLFILTGAKFCCHVTAKVITNCIPTSVLGGVQDECPFLIHFNYELNEIIYAFSDIFLMFYLAWCSSKILRVLLH